MDPPKTNLVSGSFKTWSPNSLTLLFLRSRICLPSPWIWPCDYLANEYSRQGAVPISGSRSSETGSCHFLSPGTLVLGSQPPCQRKARAVCEEERPTWGGTDALSRGPGWTPSAKVPAPRASRPGAPSPASPANDTEQGSAAPVRPRPNGGYLSTIQLVVLTATKSRGGWLSGSRTLVFLVLGRKPLKSFQTVNLPCFYSFKKAAATPSILSTPFSLEKTQLIFLNEDGDLQEFYS